MSFTRPTARTSPLARRDRARPASRACALAAALLAFAGAAPAAGAQVVEDPEWLPQLVVPVTPLLTASTCVFQGGYPDCHRDDKTGAAVSGGSVAAEMDQDHFVGLAQARYSGAAGQLGVYAVSGGGNTNGVAAASAKTVEQFALRNVGTYGLWQDIDFFAHAVSAGMVGSAADRGVFSHWATLYQYFGGRWYEVGTKGGMQLWNVDNPEAEAEYKAHHRFSVYVLPEKDVGTLLFALVTAVNAEAQGNYEVDGMHTGTVYMPRTAGIQIGTRGGFLRDQRIPDWARPQQVVPEPSTVALTLGGIVALGIGTRRRTRQATPAAARR